MSEKKSFLLRIDAQVFDKLQKWASDDLRSVNAHIEFLLRQSLEQHGRMKKENLGSDEKSKVK